LSQCCKDISIIYNRPTIRFYITSVAETAGGKIKEDDIHEISCMRQRDVKDYKTLVGKPNKITWGPLTLMGAYY